jgi:hypothetical protein
MQDQDKFATMVLFLREQINYMLGREVFMLFVLSACVYGAYAQVVNPIIPVAVAFVMLIDIFDFLNLRNKTWFNPASVTPELLQRETNYVLGAKFSPSGIVIIVVLALLTGVLVLLNPQKNAQAAGVAGWGIIALTLIGIPYMLKQLRRYKLGVRLDGDPDKIFEQLNKKMIIIPKTTGILFIILSLGMMVFGYYVFVLVMVYAIVYFYATRRIQSYVTDNYSELIQSQS